MILYLDMPTYLARYLLHLTGGIEPVILRKHSAILAIIKNEAQKPPKHYKPDLPRKGALAIEVGETILGRPYVPPYTRAAIKHIIKNTLDTAMLIRVAHRKEPSEAKALEAFVSENHIGAAYTDTIRKRYYRLKLKNKQKTL